MQRPIMIKYGNRVMFNRRRDNQGSFHTFKLSRHNIKYGPYTL
jgi:hypothetical protein